MQHIGSAQTMKNTSYGLLVLSFVSHSSHLPHEPVFMGLTGLSLLGSAVTQLSSSWSLTDATETLVHMSEEPEKQNDPTQ